MSILKNQNKTQTKSKTMSPGLYLLGGSQGRGCRGSKCLVALEYVHNVM